MVRCMMCLARRERVGMHRGDKSVCEDGLVMVQGLL